MFSWWLFYHLPLWLQIIAIGVPAIIALVLLGNIFGWDRVRRWIGPLIALFVALAVAAGLRKAGYADRKVDEQRTTDKAVATVDQKRQENAVKTDDQVKKETDRWSR